VETISEVGAVPGWRQAGRGESRWPTVAAVAVAVGLQVALPNRFAPRIGWCPAWSWRC